MSSMVIGHSILWIHFIDTRNKQMSNISDTFGMPKIVLKRSCADIHTQQKNAFIFIKMKLRNVIRTLIYYWLNIAVITLTCITFVLVTVKIAFVCSPTNELINSAHANEQKKEVLIYLYTSEIQMCWLVNYGHSKIHIPTKMPTVHKFVGYLILIRVHRVHTNRLIIT